MQLFQAGQRHATSHKIEQRCIPKTSRATVQRNAPCCNVRHALVAQFCRRCDIVYHYSVLYTSFEITDLVVRWSWCLLVEIFNCICLFEQFSMTEFFPNTLLTFPEFPFDNCRIPQHFQVFRTSSLLCVCALLWPWRICQLPYDFSFVGKHILRFPTNLLIRLLL